MTETDLQGDALEYRRARDKADKSLELYKFQVNALYVAMTRAVETLTLVEQDTGHPLLVLLGMRLGEAQAQPVAKSSVDEWAQEARRLELQGKAEQAQAIRDTFLQHKPVPWTPWSRGLVEALAPKALDPKNPSSKPRQTLFEYALWHGQLTPDVLAAIDAVLADDSLDGLPVAADEEVKGANKRKKDKKGKKKAAAEE